MARIGTATVDVNINVHASGESQPSDLATAIELTNAMLGASAVRVGHVPDTSPTQAPTPATSRHEAQNEWCMAPVLPTMRWLCTLKRGHEHDEHIAHHRDGRVLARVPVAPHLDARAASAPPAPAQPSVPDHVRIANNPPPWAEATAWKCAVAAVHEFATIGTDLPLEDRTATYWFGDTRLVACLRRHVHERITFSPTYSQQTNRVISAAINAYERARFQPSSTHAAFVPRERRRS